MGRDLLRLAAGAVGLALAIWLLPASVHIVDWPARQPHRIAFYPPVAGLWVAAGAAAAIVAAIARLGRASLAVAADVAAPFALLWVWALPYVPWLPDRAPLLLIFAGPLRWGILALAAAGAIERLACRREPRRRGERLEARVCAPAGRGAADRAAVFVLVAAFALAAGLSWAEAIGPGGDEPHYLTITQSLLLDHDLKIENNHARGDYREYFGGPLRPDYLQRGIDGEIYSIHAPGLPALLLPAYAAAGYPGAVAAMACLASLVAVAVFGLAESAANRRTAWIVAAAICLSVPFVPHEWLIYPEMPAALVVAWSALWMKEPGSTRVGAWVFRGAAIGVLPWLHTKYAVLLACLAGFLVIRLWPRRGLVVAFAGPMALSVALWFLYFYRIYGVFDPQAPYGTAAITQMQAANIPRSLLGLLFDQKFGLLPYSPVYLLAVPGAAVMLRRSAQRGFALALLFTIAAFVLVTARFYMWWGGSSAPARFLVPVLPLAAPFTAAGLASASSAASRGLAALLIAASLIVAAAGIIEPERRLLFSAPHGVSNLVAAVQAGSPATALLPTFTEESIRGSVLLLARWLAALTGAAVVAVLARRAAVRASSAAGIVLVAFLLLGAVASGSPAAGADRQDAAARGRLSLLAAAGDPRLQAFDYAARARVSLDRVLSSAALILSRGSPSGLEVERRVAGPFELPAGRYVIRTMLSAPVEGSIAVEAGDGVRFAEQRGLLPAAGEMSFELPVDAAVAVSVNDEEVARRLLRLELAAKAIHPRDRSVAPLAIERIPGRSGAFIAYVDRNTYPEHGVFWTRATRTGTVLVSPAGAPAIVLTLHVGPPGGRVQLRIAGRAQAIGLGPGETRRIEVPLAGAGDAGLVPLTIGVDRSFQPRRAEPGSSDSRWLGCQVRVDLKERSEQ